MTVTRSNTGHTPKKRDIPDYVETPGTKGSTRSSRKSLASEDLSSSSETTLTKRSKSKTRESNGSSRPPGRPRKSISGKRALESSQIDHAPLHFEFGGTFGVSAAMIGFPALMYYMWVGATYYDGKLPLPVPGQNFKEFLIHIGRVIYEGAFPTLRAWSIYWVFFVVEAAFYLYMPGIYCKGKQLEHLNNKALDYYCSGMWSFYTSIALAGTLHYTGLFKLYTLIDEFGPLMSVSIISGFLVSIVAYFSAIYRGAQHRMTGYFLYDFFMGAELNPRLFGILDFKMFFEVRLPWFILFFFTLGACARQYDQLGYVTGELAFLLMAHWLYANACCKGEELIPTTWDMYYEKWGFMLIFWNMAGVPLSYCHATIYLANHAPSTYRWNKPFLIFLYVTYLFAYWIWDTCGSQKNNFRGRQKGTAVSRTTFPQLPWRNIENPMTIPVEGGDDLLCDGWYKYARKIHYTCDTYFAITWALVTGFESPFPWFYPVFFIVMIIHRASRDIAKCRERYGKSWEEFERRTPYLYIPYVF